MTDNRQLIQATIDVIENMALEDLHRYPELELLLPRLYESLIIDDECVHKYDDQGECICGATKPNKYHIGEQNNECTQIQQSTRDAGQAGSSRNNLAA